MRQKVTGIALTVAMLLAGLPAAAAAHGDDPTYLALGDSQAFGFGTERPDQHGYVASLSRWLRSFDCRDGQPSGCPHLELVDLSVPGATTTSLISDQLPDALSLLAERNWDADPGNDVEFITVTIGGNDIFSPLVSACSGGVTLECQQTIAAVFAQAGQNLGLILGSLRAAAGPGTVIAISTYENGLGNCVLADLAGFADLALEGGPGVIGFNQIIEAIAAQTGVLVADMFGELEPDDWVGGNDCIHPDKSGYHKMAKVFLETMD